MASARVPFLLLLLVDIAASARVAVLIYGHHPSLLTEHKALVFDPLEAVATVDVFVVGNNRSKSFPDLVSAYASLRPSSSEGLFASAGSVDGSTASAAFLLSGLRLLERTAQSHPQLLLQSSSSSSSSSSSTTSASPWHAVLVLHSAILPLIEAPELAFAPGGLVIPWREAPAGGESSTPSHLTADLS